MVNASHRERCSRVSPWFTLNSLNCIKLDQPSHTIQEAVFHYLQNNLDGLKKERIIVKMTNDSGQRTGKGQSNSERDLY